MTRSLVSLIAGVLVLRAAAGAMGQNIQFYFNAIHDAALNPDSPLRHIVGAAHVYPISYTLGGIIIATFFASELLGSLVLGAWSDRYGRKLFIIFGPLFGAIAVQITALTTAVWMLVITRLLEGLSTASNAPATLSYMAETTSHSATLRTRLSGFFEIATIGGIALGSVIGGWLWQNFGTAAIVIGIPLTSPAFALNALIYLASLVILWLGIHELKEQRRAPQAAVGAGETVKRYWKIVSSPRVAGFVPAWIAINGVMGIWMNMTVRILTDKNSFPGQLLAGHFNSQQAGDLFALFMALLCQRHLRVELFLPPGQEDHRHADRHRGAFRHLPDALLAQSPTGAECAAGAAAVRPDGDRRHGAERLYPGGPGAPGGYHRSAYRRPRGDHGAVFGLPRPGPVPGHAGRRAFRRPMGR